MKYRLIWNVLSSEGSSRAVTEEVEADNFEGAVHYGLRRAGELSEPDDEYSLSYPADLTGCEEMGDAQVEAE